MPDPPFDVIAAIYEGIQIETIVQEELFKAAKRAEARWKQNLTRGHGVVPARRGDGTRNTSWVNTGEGRDSITTRPQQQGAYAYTIGSNKVQVAVAETGRKKTPNSPPPFEAIAQWVHEKRIARRGDEGFDEVVDAIRWGIAQNGIPGFAPGHEAGKREGDKLVRRTDTRIQEAVEDLDVTDRVQD